MLQLEDDYKGCLAKLVGLTIRAKGGAELVGFLQEGGGKNAGVLWVCPDHLSKLAEVTLVI